MTAAVMLLIAVLGFQQGPPPLDRLPPANRVTDKARPDFGYMRPWAGSVVTVIVVYGAECGACDASVSFYRRLASAPGIDGKAGRFIVLTSGGIMPVSTKIETHPQGFKLDRVVSYPEDDRFGVTEFPTLLIIDGSWKRRGEWRGVLSPQQESAALALIKKIADDAKAGGR